MNWLGIYHKLPHPLRMLAVSARGKRLDRRRYGGNTNRLVREALERESWSAEQWNEWQKSNLAVLLERAARLVPFYREEWQKRRMNKDRASITYIENWPVLQKDALRAKPQAFLAEDVSRRLLWEEHTSGTSGTPLVLWRSKATERSWYALFEARARIWNGVNRKDRWGILGGQLVVPVEQSKPPFWVWNSGLHQLYLSAQHLSYENSPAYLKAMRENELVYLLGYPSALATLAQGVLDLGLKPAPLKVILTNAEMLLPVQRTAIENAFGCPVVDTYGMSEIAAAGSECAHKSMHLWPEAGLVEVFSEEEDCPIPAGQTGRLICTGLLNEDMPLIRYQVGDRGSLAPAQPACACGRSLPILAEIDGRLDDVIVTADGRRIGRLDPVFKADLPLREAQIIQESLNEIRVLIVPEYGFDKRSADTIRQGLRDRLGPVNVEIEAVAQIPRGANGKFKAVVSRMTQPVVRDPGK